MCLLHFTDHAMTYLWVVFYRSPAWWHTCVTFYWLPSNIPVVGCISQITWWPTCVYRSPSDLLVQHAVLLWEKTQFCALDETTTRQCYHRSVSFTLCLSACLCWWEETTGTSQRSASLNGHSKFGMCVWRNLTTELVSVLSTSPSKLYNSEQTLQLCKSIQRDLITGEVLVLVNLTILNKHCSFAGAYRDVRPHNWCLSEKH